MPIPFQRISVIKPGQSLTSYLSGVSDYLEKSFTVAIKWKLHPDDHEKQSLSYWLNMGDYKGVSYLGSRDPLTQLSDQVKKLREDWKSVAQGSRKLKADVFTSTDRQRESAFLEERRQREQERRAAKNKPPQASSE